MEMKGALKELRFKLRPGGWVEIYMEVVGGSKEELVKAEGTASEEEWGIQKSLAHLAAWEDHNYFWATWKNGVRWIGEELAGLRKLC